jgi:hypothetical protein
MFREVRTADPVFLYNSTQKKYLAHPQIKLQSRDELYATPILVSDASDAGLLIVVNVDLVGKPLRLQDTFMLRSVTGQVGTRIYLGSPLNSSMQHGQGAPVVFQEPTDKRQIEWIVHISRERQMNPDTPIYYGVPYQIRQRYTDKSLVMSPNGSFLKVEATNDNDTTEEWIMLPTFPIYTCQRGVEQCVQTRGKDNAFSPIQCYTREERPDLTSGMDSTCINQYNERVFFSQEECRTSCGILPNIDEKKEQVTGGNIFSNPVVQKSHYSTPSSSADVTILVVVAMIVIGLIVECFIFFRVRLR